MYKRRQTNKQKDPSLFSPKASPYLESTSTSLGGSETEPSCVLSRLVQFCPLPATAGIPGCGAASRGHSPGVWGGHSPVPKAACCTPAWTHCRPCRFSGLTVHPRIFPERQISELPPIVLPYLVRHSSQLLLSLNLSLNQTQDIMAWTCAPSPAGGKEPTLPIQETWVWSLGWEDPLEKGMAIRSSSCLENRHGQRSLVGYSPRWSQRVRCDWVTEQARPLQNPYVEVLTPRAVVLRAGLEVVTFERPWGLSVLRRRWRDQSSAPAVWGPSQRAALCKPGRQCPPRAGSANTLTLDFSASPTLRSTCWHVSHPVCGPVFQ